MFAGGGPIVAHEPAESVHRILVVTSDDERAETLRNTLEVEGLGWVVAVADARKALPAFRVLRPDLVVVDAWLDQMDAGAVIRQLDARSEDNEFLPFLVLGSNAGRPATIRALDASVPAFYRAADDPAHVAADIRRLLAIRERRFEVGQAADRMMAKAQRIEYETAARLAQVARLKDHDAHDHVYRVGRLAMLIATELGLERDECERIRAAAPLHDIGMIGIADAIRLKDGPLSLEELDVIKTHTVLGARILAGGSSELFRMAEEIALYHHENWDGTGYTPGLEGEAIPLAGRIVRVADIFDAVMRPRAFQGPWTREEAIEFLRGRSGHVFDPVVASAFLQICERGADEAADEAVEAA